MIKKEYNLPDILPLNDNSFTSRFFTWVPDKNYLVLGKSNKPENSIIFENANDIEIVKRPSGGETVILTPNTLVISGVKRAIKLKDTWNCFKNFNLEIIDILTELGIENVGQKGISDITIGNKKILGSSMYRRKNDVFYHAVLNISESTDLMEKYIAHPTKEPDYRKGRRHSDFVTSLKEEGYNFTPHQIADKLSSKNKAA